MPVLRPPEWFPAPLLTPGTKDNLNDDSLASLLNALADDGVMLGGHGADLVEWDKRGRRRVVARALLQRMERGEYRAPESRRVRATRAKEALEAWKRDFVAVHGRKPSKSDLDGDPTARELFAQFSALTKLG